MLRAGDAAHTQPRAADASQSDAEALNYLPANLLLALIGNKGAAIGEQEKMAERSATHRTLSMGNASLDRPTISGRAGYWLSLSASPFKLLSDIGMTVRETSLATMRPG